LARIEMAVSENIPNRLMSRRFIELLGRSHNQQSVVAWCCHVETLPCGAQYSPAGEADHGWLTHSRFKRAPPP